MADPIPENALDPDLMNDFFLDFKEAHQTCENCLIDLEHDSGNRDLLNSLFRSVHTIKGNLIYVGLKALTPLIQSVEDVLDAVRHESVQYDAFLSDVILLAMDKTRQMVEAAVQNQPIPLDNTKLPEICQRITLLADVSENRMDAVQSVMELMAPETQLITPIPIPPQALNDEPGAPASTPSPHTTHPLPSIEELFREYQIPINDDLIFFQKLCAPLEQRSYYWEGRTQRLLHLTLAMNRHAGEPVEPMQMVAAVFVHDIAMAFLPLDLLHKTTTLHTEDRLLLQSHPAQAFSLLSTLRHWEQASHIVLEHHEREDGSGYPTGLFGESICPGAKILAIADTFDARTHERAYSTNTKRPLIRAILEINRCADSQFDPMWVDVFNEVSRSSPTFA